MKKLPVILSSSNVMLFFVGFHVLVLTFSFWEIFEWINRWLIDNTYSDPAITAWLFWVVESLVVLFILGRRYRPRNLGGGV